MNNSKRTASLDEVLADYGRASREFDAKVLQTFIDKYPEHARALQRYAHVQLTSVPATPDEINDVPLPTEEILPRQSLLLQRMQQLRGSASAADANEAAAKLASISGERAMQAAAIAVFGAYEHGEDLLLLSVVESASDVRDVPDWFIHDLSTHVGVVATALIEGMAINRQQSVGLQRFSAKEKPNRPAPMTWEQVVEDCITNDAVKRVILERAKRP